MVWKLEMFMAIWFTKPNCTAMLCNYLVYIKAIDITKYQFEYQKSDILKILSFLNILLVIRRNDQSWRVLKKFDHLDHQS